MTRDQMRNQIRRLRFQHGEMTQQQLADQARCTRQTIIALEQGNKYHIKNQAVKNRGGRNKKTDGQEPFHEQFVF